jgi:CRISPR-associated protein Cas2
MQEVLVTYDVSTETKEGRRRLRKVATVCCGFGQRVQNSVFECRVTPAQLEAMEFKLLTIIDEGEDRLRIYLLPPNRSKAVRIYGLLPPHDLREPLIV